MIPAGDTFEVRYVNSLNEMCMATPAMVGSKLFIRTLEHLYCIEEVRPQASSRLEALNVSSIAAHHKAAMHAGQPQSTALDLTLPK